MRTNRVKRLVFAALLALSMSGGTAYAAVPDWACNTFTFWGITIYLPNFTDDISACRL